MANGTVKWFNGQKGYGFIQPEEGGSDVFVHISAVERAGLSSLREGQKIAYETERGRNGKIGPDRRCAAAQHDDRLLAYRVGVRGWYRRRSVSEGQRECSPLATMRALDPGCVKTCRLL